MNDTRLAHNLVVALYDLIRLAPTDHRYRPVPFEEAVHEDEKFLEATDNAVAHARALLDGLRSTRALERTNVRVAELEHWRSELTNALILIGSEMEAVNKEMDA